MIATDITGSAGGDAAQVFNLLAVVANPDAYGEKLKALVTATEEHKKFLALVAPATEILDIRQKIEADKAAAKQALEDAQLEATNIKDAAAAQAKAIMDEATAAAATARKLAQEAQAASTAKLAEIDTVLSSLQSQVQSTTEAEIAAQTAHAAAKEELAAVEVEKKAVNKMKERLTAKAKAFIDDIAK